MSTLIVRSITCRETKEAVDEPYLLVNIDQHHSRIVWGPVSMDDGESETIDEEIDFNEWVRVELWESDSHRHRRYDDRIGSFIVNADDRGEAEVFLPNIIAGHRHVSYSLTYEVLGEDELPVHPGRIDLISLECNDAQERTDEVYLMVNDRQVWGPRDMVTGQLRPVDQSVNFANVLRVELWERDRSHSDCFGTLRPDLAAIEPGGQLSHVFRRDRGIVGDARYTLAYRIS